MASFNRTILECKDSYLRADSIIIAPFNRTILECKDNGIKSYNSFRGNL